MATVEMTISMSLNNVIGGLGVNLLFYDDVVTNFFNNCNHPKTNIIIGRNSFLQFFDLNNNKNYNKKIFVLTHETKQHCINEKVYFVNLQILLQILNASNETFTVIGGLTVFNLMLPYATKLHIFRNEFFLDSPNGITLNDCTLFKEITKQNKTSIKDNVNYTLLLLEKKL